MSRFLRRGVLPSALTLTTRRTLSTSALRFASAAQTSAVSDSAPQVDSRTTGIERLELLTLAKEFQGDTILTGKFGTLEEPVIVHSWFPSRIVGCQGSHEHPHEILWHEVRRGRDTVCLECGQVFRLRPNLFHQLLELETELFPPPIDKEMDSH